MRLISTTKYLYFFVAFLLIIPSVLIADNPSYLTVNQLTEESKKLYIGERYPEALEYALSAVKLIEYNSKDIHSLKLIIPLNNLAIIQEKLQYNSDAIKTYKRIIDLVEREGGVFDVRLSALINRTGYLLQKDNKHEQAIELFQLSQHINHRAKGVYNLDQITTLNLMTNSYLLTGELDKANATQNFRYLVNHHVYGQGSLLIVPSMIKLAKFKSMLRLYDDAWLLYTEAIQIIERSLDKKHLSLINLLLELATIMQNQLAFGEYNEMKNIQFQFDVNEYDSQSSFNTSQKFRLPPRKSNTKEAFNALSREVQIMDHHKEKISLANRVAVYVNFGDLCMVTRNKRSQGIAMYIKAIQLLDSESNTEILKQQYFGQPKRLQYRKPKLFENSDNIDTIFIETTFIVLANGSVKNIKIVVANASVYMRSQFKKEVRKSIYRPKFVNKKPVNAIEHLREEFVGEISII